MPSNSNKNQINGHMNSEKPQSIAQKELLSLLAQGKPLKGREIAKVDFTEYCFKKKLDFRGAIFTDKTVFQKTKFLEGVNFRNTSLQNADLQYVEGLLKENWGSHEKRLQV